MTDSTPGDDATLGSGLLAFRIIGVSLGLGVTFFALVSGFIRLDGPPAAPATELDPATMFNILLLVAIGALGLAVVWWRARVAPLLERRHDGDATDAHARFAAIQTNVIITWAMAETAAIFCVLFYFLFGDITTGVAGVVIIWLAVALTWPKRSWFESGQL